MLAIPCDGLVSRKSSLAAGWNPAVLSLISRVLAGNIDFVVSGRSDIWEHTVRDQDDLKRCADYCHWNPCKHQLVPRVCDWEWSSFHRFVNEGEYDLYWDELDPVPGWDEPEWGE